MKNSNSLEHAQHVVKRVLESGFVLTDPYDQWVTVGMACTEFDEQGRQLFHDLSSMSSKYDQRSTDRKYDELLRTSRGQVTFATVAHMAKNAGVDLSAPKGRPKITEEKKKEKRIDTVREVKKLLNSKYSFRFNTLKECIEVCPVGKFEWKPIDDRAFMTAFVETTETGIKVDRTLFDSIIHDKRFSVDFNPIRDYLSKLSQWDRETDYIEQLFDHIIFKDEAERAFAMPFLKMWFINLVALALGITDDNQLMPNLVGVENIGKSFIEKNILPPELRPYMKVMTPDDQFDKDTYIALSEFILIVFDEFKLTDKTSRSMKAFITMNDTSLRAAYAHFKKLRKRKASIIGNGNDIQYIRDYEGNRRYVSVHIIGTKNIYEYPINYEGAYSQALTIISNGDCKFSLTQEETAAIKAHNQEFMITDDCEDAIMTNFRIPADDETGIAMSATDILLEIRAFVPTKTTAVDIGTAMTRLHFPSKTKHKQKKYYVLRNNSEEIRCTREREGKEFKEELHPEPVQENAQEVNPELPF